MAIDHPSSGATLERGGRPGGREDGRTRLIATLLRFGAVSRADLARHSGLAASTVTGLIASLQADGLVSEREREAAQGPGRPGTRLALGRSAGVVVGLDFGKRHVSVAVSDLAHDPVADQRVAHDADLSATEQIACARTLLDEALHGAGVDRSAVVSIAAGIPGPVHHPTGHIGDSSILPGWVGLPATESLSEAFGRDVTVDNDANLGGLAEWMWGASRGSRHAVYLKLSTGIGSGLIVDGRPFAGSGGTAGGVGHIQIEPGGPVCRCGRRGCLEAVTGSALVVERVRRVHARVSSVGDVIELARSGDRHASEALQHCGTAVGTALGAVCSVLNPQVVVLGGELASAGEVLSEPLVAALGASTVRSAATDVEVRMCALGDRAEVAGAVALALRTCRAADLG